jgi:hypothetical protein
LNNLKRNKMKQETAEEVAERYYPPYPDEMVTSEVYA